MSESQNSINIFNTKDNNKNNLEDNIENQFQKRSENFSNEENYNKYKEDMTNNDLKLNDRDRDRRFKQKRLNKEINLDNIQNLKSKLTISLDLYEQCNNMNVDINDMPNIINEFKTNEIEKKYKGLVGIRKLLCLPNNPPIQQIIDYGLVSDFIDLLQNGYPEFQYECLWILTNITSGTSDQSNTIIVKGGLNKIIDIMNNSSIEELQSQSIMTLGNIAGESIKIREQIIERKGFDKIVYLLSITNRPTIIKNSTWAISNFLRIKPLLPYDVIKNSISSIAGAINKLPNDKEFLRDALWIFSFITENYKKGIDDLMFLGIIPNLLKFLEINEIVIQLSILRIVGNIASGNANQTQALIDWGVLNYLKKTLFHEKKTIRKESAWIVSNIAAGTQKQIETLINEDFLKILTEVVNKDDAEIQKEAIWAICNLTSIEKDELLEKILKDGILELICKCLTMKDAKYLAVSLEAFGNLLAYGKKIGKDGVNPIVVKVGNMGIFDVLESLQLHPVEVVYEKTIKLLETYFETENNI